MAVVAPSGDGQEARDLQLLAEKGILARAPRPWSADLPDDLAHVRDLFCAQARSVSVLGVYRVENSGLGKVYGAVRDTMDYKQERLLWHGTSAGSARDIVLSGFNRAHSGTHGVELGRGSYFSSEAGGSIGMCDPRQSRHVVLLAKVLVGAWTKGSPELLEPPHRDEDALLRYDSMVDDVNSPTVFCVCRDYQALPLYLVEFFCPGHLSTPR